MRLSDAIALGRTLVGRCVIGGSSSEEAQAGDGCVLDMAALAVGLNKWQKAKNVWPWLSNQDPNSALGVTYEVSIYDKFDGKVMVYKSMTLDQLIDWIRSVEPAEAEETSPRQVREACQRFEAK